MNNLEQPNTATEEQDLIATQTMNQADMGDIDGSTDIIWNPEAQFTSEELNKAHQAAAEILTSLLIVSALEKGAVEEQDTFVEAVMDESVGQSKEDPTIDIQVMPLNSLEQELDQAA